MTNRPSEESIRLRIANVISDSEELMFERLDNLHKLQITDTDVVNYLRTEGMEAVARRYAEWQDMPVDFAEDDNTTMNPRVPDPGDAPSYRSMAEELDAAGINDSNLLDAIQSAAQAKRDEERK